MAMRLRKPGERTETAVKPRVQKQGKIVVERDENGTGYLMMYPDGEIVHRSSRGEVKRWAKRWFKDHVNLDAVGVGTIEWRL